MVDFILARRFDVGRIERAGYWSDEDVAVLAGGSAEMQVTEAEDAAATYVTELGCTTVEVLHIGTDLHHTEGQGCTDERIPTPVDAEEGIDIARQVWS